MRFKHISNSRFCLHLSLDLIIHMVLFTLLPLNQNSNIHLIWYPRTSMIVHHRPASRPFVFFPPPLPRCYNYRMSNGGDIFEKKTMIKLNLRGKE